MSASHKYKLLQKHKSNIIINSPIHNCGTINMNGVTVKQFIVILCDHCTNVTQIHNYKYIVINNGMAMNKLNNNK